MVNTNYKAYRPKAYLLDQIPNKKKDEASCGCASTKIALHTKLS